MTAVGTDMAKRAVDVNRINDGSGRAQPLGPVTVVNASETVGRWRAGRARLGEARLAGRTTVGPATMVVPDRRSGQASLCTMREDGTQSRGTEWIVQGHAMCRSRFAI